ncbi:acyl-CoA dehydrogenase family protein [Streptomyces sp. NPDC054904]|uniref:acyl-CoA dehydrogenase family protein n=1 Tax=unclassified Streptomyces TaxID=2593676 RepID=UPI002481BD41|nr:MULTISPECIES: acyl-CoA dehydrogenase family protein [unclassified Streptomyces]MDA5283049.1 acyl-CoA/acyl-ACP dehydrogenase [Streptomyces sp. Isolate_45]MDX2394259.1 acyl-CoA/acyl-ACP dehydrogenase [Streptomyces sp. DK15]
MRSLTTARGICEQFHPGLLDALENLPLTSADGGARESADSPVLELYREHAGPGLLVPAAYGGAAAGPLEAVRVQRALAAASPSLGVASTMHHFTVAMLFRLAEVTDRLTPTQLKVMTAVASDGLLLASGWAEGRTSQNILTPSVVAERTPGGYRVNGSKKPCSLSRSMDVLTASVAVTGDDGRSGLALMLIPASSPGITTRPFWGTPVLAAAQSDEVVFTDVEVPADLVIHSTPEDADRLDDLQTAGFTWFELLATATYVGAASELVARVVAGGRGTADERARLVVRLDAAVALVEGAARALEDGTEGDEAVAAVLTARYASQDLLASAVDQAVEMLGGMAFIRSADVAYLASAVRALAFHPPSRASVAAELADYFAGSPLRLS